MTHRNWNGSYSLSFRRSVTAWVRKNRLNTILIVHLSFNMLTGSMFLAFWVVVSICNRTSLPS